MYGFIQRMNAEQNTKKNNKFCILISFHSHILAILYFILKLHIAFYL